MTKSLKCKVVIPTNLKPIHKTDRFEIYVLGVNNIYIKMKNDIIHNHVFSDSTVHLTGNHTEIVTHV